LAIVYDDKCRDGWYITEGSKETGFGCVGLEAQDDSFLDEKTGYLDSVSIGKLQDHFSAYTRTHPLFSHSSHSLLVALSSGQLVSSASRSLRSCLTSHEASYELLLLYRKGNATL
jgi:hypothetical protein